MSILMICAECHYAFRPERMAGVYCKGCARKLADTDQLRTSLAEHLVRGKGDKT